MPRKTYWDISLRWLVINVGSAVLMVSIIVVTSFQFMVRSNNYWVLIGNGIISGILFGLVWGNIIAPCDKGASLSLTFKNKCELINNIDNTLKRMNYHLESRNNDVLVYSSSKWIGYFIGKISIHLTDTSITIAGSSKYIKKIGKHLKAA
ncbi:MAG TPA: hypothetical protein VHY08_02340 [Bacillota bacterium]|nr:hypothetical protein [Bacillota bacterium]